VHLFGTLKENITSGYIILINIRE